MELLDSLPRAGWKVWVAAIIGSVLLLGIVLIGLLTVAIIAGAILEAVPVS